MQSEGSLLPCPLCSGGISVTYRESSNIITCDECGISMSDNDSHKLMNRWNNRNYDNDRLVYVNLRHYFRRLVDDVLGKGYCNEAMDVYKADKYTCRDLKKAFERRKRFLGLF